MRRMKLKWKRRAQYADAAQLNTQCESVADSVSVNLKTEHKVITTQVELPNKFDGRLSLEPD